MKGGGAVLRQRRQKVAVGPPDLFEVELKPRISVGLCFIDQVGGKRGAPGGIRGSIVTAGWSDTAKPVETSSTVRASREVKVGCPVIRRWVCAWARSATARENWMVAAMLAGPSTCR